jgi:co-chaperonin GroES (HSP10)
MSELYKSIEPIGDRVVVKRQPTVAHTPGGLALPEQSRTLPRVGTVIAVGPGNHRLLSSEGKSDRLPMQCKVGDVVMLPGMAECFNLDPADKSSELVVCTESQLPAILHQD